MLRTGGMVPPDSTATFGMLVPIRSQSQRMGVKNDGVRSVPQSISTKSLPIRRDPSPQLFESPVEPADCIERLRGYRQVIGGKNWTS
jgi:hypothetical protein